MKKSLISFIVLASIGQVYASECVQDICLRDMVIDSNDRIGVVSSIETNTNGSLIKFTESNSGHSYSATYERLAKKVNSARFPEGSFVIDSSNHIGSISSAFSNGKVELVEESTKYKYVSSKVTSEVSNYSGIAKGKYVIDSNNRFGKTLHVFEKGQTQFIEDGTGYTYIVASATAETDAIDGLAKGVVAIDSNKRIGVVQVVFANGYAVYKEADTNYAYVSKSLSPEAAQLANGSKKGSLVIDDNDRYGLALHVFSNGLGQFKEASTGYIYVVTALYPEVSELDGLKKDAFAIDTNNRIGKVQTVFKNAKVVYKEIDTGYSYVSKGLSVEVAALENGLKPGMTTIDSSERIGKVLHTFANQKAQYREISTGYSYTSLSPFPEVEEMDGLSKNIVAIDSNNRIGKVIYVFANKKSMYKEISTGYSYTSSSLLPEVSHFDGVAKNARIIDQSDRIGMTDYVFKDGRVQFKESSTGYTYVVRQAFPEVSELGKLKAGMVVLDQAHHIGKIAYLFRNGKIANKEFSTNYLYVVSSVSPEVDSLDGYNKDEEYSSDSYHVGKVKRFFENKKMEFVADNFSFVVTELFSEVNEFNTYQVEQKINDSEGDEGTVKKVFANGAILYEAKKKLAGDQEAKMHILSAKVFGAKEAELKQDMTGWLSNLGRKLSENGTFWGASNRHPLVIKTEDYSEFKTELVEFLKKNDDIFYDKKLQKKVLKFLGGVSDGDPDDNHTTPDINSIVSIQLNDQAYRSVLEPLLTKKKIRYYFTSEIEAKKPILTVTVKKLKSTLFVHKCLVQMSLIQESGKTQAFMKKTTWSLKKTACSSVVKKVLANIFN